MKVLQSCKSADGKEDRERAEDLFQRAVMSQDSLAVEYAFHQTPGDLSGLLRLFLEAEKADFSRFVALRSMHAEHMKKLINDGR